MDPHHSHADWEQVLVPGSVTSVAADGDTVLVSCTSGHVARLPGDTGHVTLVAACPGEEGDTWTSSGVGVGGGLVTVTRWGRDRGEAVVAQLEVRRGEDMGLLHTLRRRKPDKNFCSLLAGNSVFIRCHLLALLIFRFSFDNSNVAGRAARCGSWSGLTTVITSVSG